jgi:hypothetical protein
MRDWRKIGKAILTSDRMPLCSFESLWLWTLLVPAQDDKGRYPWTNSKVAALCAAYGWNYDKATKLAEELVKHGIADWDNKFLHLTNGEIYNGQPTYAKQAFIYEEAVQLHESEVTSVLSEVTVSTGGARPTTSPLLSSPSGERIVKGRGVDPEFITLMVTAYEQLLGGEAGVRDRIEEAMNHTASDKAKNKKVYVRAWLRRDAERLQANGNGHGPPHNRRPEMPPVGTFKPGKEW